MSGTVSTRWYFSDWLSDPALRACGYAARGLWKDMLCIAAANKGREYGFVTLNGRPLDAVGIAKQTGGTGPQVAALLIELERNGVFSRDKRKAIYCRRMVRAQKSRGNGRLGGNPKLLADKEKQNPDNPPLPLPMPEPNPKKGKSRADARTTLRLDWQLTVANIDYAKENGFELVTAQVIAAAFSDFHRSRGNRMADWDAAWRTWVRNEVKFNNRRPGGGNDRPDRSASRAGGELERRLRTGEVTIPPRPSVLRGAGDAAPRLIPPGRRE